MSVRRCLLVPLFVLAALLPFAGVSAAQDSELEVVASDLDNPRGLAFGPWGGLYVTEAGRGGEGPCIGSVEEEGIVCAGATGAITKIWHGKQRRVLEGLPSIAAQDTGDEALGPQDISFSGFSAYFVVGLGGNPDLRDDLGEELGPQFGQLYKVSPFGRVRAVADLAAFEAAENPDQDQPEGAEPNSNPNSVLSRSGRRYVVDAGGNDLLKVGPTGRIRTLAVFPERLVPAPPGFPVPEISMQAVPTAVVRGPDHALYVSQLTGFPFPKGGAKVYRVDKRGGEPEEYESGFTNITDLAFGPDGSLYVLEFATEGLLAEPPSGGALIRVAPDGSRTTIASEGLVAPTGVTVSRKGDIYVSNYGALAGVGEVVRIDGGGWK
ncbi:MAG: ScyD/ScyE family protein [Actinomycetota bacterium]|nr:ScyD/ScyE family protein [Actinomycetota bacterium]